MSNWIKRLRVFAGPNGSGKSTLYDYLVKTKAFHSYYHINPDVIAKNIAVSLDLDDWPIGFSFDEVKRFLDTSPFQQKVNFRLSESLVCQGRKISLKDPAFNDISYLATALADFMRSRMLCSASSFSFETVLSHVSKIQELKKAKELNFRIYLYFITTSDPDINFQRVENRLESGGHGVPKDKIKDRYYRAMKNLYDAFMLSNRVYLFDNSSKKKTSSFDFFAEKNGKRVYFSNPSSVPQWFGEYVLKYLDGE